MKWIIETYPRRAIQLFEENKLFHWEQHIHTKQEPVQELEIQLELEKQKVQDMTQTIFQLTQRIESLTV